MLFDRSVTLGLPLRSPLYVRRPMSTIVDSPP